MLKQLYVQDNLNDYGFKIKALSIFIISLGAIKSPFDGFMVLIKAKLLFYIYIYIYTYKEDVMR